MGISLGHLIILLVIVLLFGGKRLPELGGAMGKGLRSFKRGLEGKLEEDEAPQPLPQGQSAEKSAEKEAEKDPVHKA